MTTNQERSAEEVGAAILLALSAPMAVTTQYINATTPIAGDAFKVPVKKKGPVKERQMHSDKGKKRKRASENGQSGNAPVEDEPATAKSKPKPRSRRKADAAADVSAAAADVSAAAALNSASAATLTTLSQGSMSPPSAVAGVMPSPRSPPPPMLPQLGADTFAQDAADAFPQDDALFLQPPPPPMMFAMDMDHSTFPSHTFIDPLSPEFFSSAASPFISPSPVMSPAAFSFQPASTFQFNPPSMMTPFDFMPAAPMTFNFPSSMSSAPTSPAQFPLPPGA